MSKRLAERWLNQLWYHHQRLALLFWPLSFLYCLVIRLRRWLYQQGILKPEKLPVPVIVVGNLTAGGTGKTPLVLWLAAFLQKAGYQPGIICSGYGGNTTAQPRTVVPGSDPADVGDESVLLAARSGCPVIACRNRLAAAKMLLQQCNCDVVLSDDGLQHYRLQRDIEILLLDAARGLGNGYCLPAGPLREPASRLQTVDLVVSKGQSPLANWCMLARCHRAYAISAPETAISLQALQPRTVRAIAGLANPQSFFDCLRAAGLELVENAFPDHHQYAASELEFGDDLAVLMTEKDAVKCRFLQRENYWAVPLDIEMNDNFGKTLLALLPEHPSMRHKNRG